MIIYMTKIYVFYLSFVLAIFISTIAIGQVTVFDDKFDNYLSGQQISCQNPTDWKTWTNNPCSLTEDAYISNTYSFSGSNSVVIQQNNDIVKEIGTPLSSGVAEINFQVFIPTGKAGYFNTLASFAPPNYVWAMQVFFNTPGTGTLDAGGQSAATFSYPQNQWFSVKVVSDLTANLGEFWINGTKIHSWQWTKGTFGSPTIVKQLDGNDFFGYTADDEMHIDDYNVVHSPYTTKVSSTPTGGNWNSNGTWVGNNVPSQNAVVEIVTGATVTLTANRNRNALTIIKGTLNCGTNNITGSGDFILSSGATLQIGSTNGISFSGATGNIRVSGTRTFNQLANYIYNGAAAQITGNGLPTTVKNLTINNAAGVTLSANTSVYGALNLINGNLLTNINTLSLGTSISNPGTLSVTSGKTIGNFTRWISNSSNILFPVGTSATKYTPVELNNVVGSGAFTVNAIPGVHPNAPGSNVLQMYWQLTNAGLTSVDLTFNYLDADVVGDENQYELGRYSGISWDILSPITLNTTDNTASISGINSFSDWTLGEDGALPVELTSFSATSTGSTIRLDWQTATEINNYGFEVERMSIVKSQQPDDWEKIGFVNGHRNSNSPKSYAFVDDKVSSENYSYRLKQIDNDGQFEYSSTVKVDLRNLSTFSLDQNYPNPFNPSTTIKFSLPTASNVKITIFNLLGQEIQTLVDETKEAGIHEINFNAQNLNSGVYLYKIEAGSFLQIRKMTLVK
jgi:hypothetical protein